jgi:hypothetical protein
MVIQVANVTRGLVSGTRGCSGVARGGARRCILLAGHDGHHFARVEVKRPDGAVVGYAYEWLDRA